MTEIAGDAPRETPCSSRGGRIKTGILVNGRVLRLIVGVVLLAVAARYGYLYLFNRMSIAGVVNAPLLTVISQLDGRANGVSASQGMSVTANAVLATVTNDRVDDRFLVEIARSLDTARATLLAKQQSLADLAAVRADHVDRAARFKAGSAERLEHATAELEASLVTARISNQQAQDGLTGLGLPQRPLRMGGSAHAARSRGRACGSPCGSVHRPSRPI
jgi:hypothetical protein